MHRFEGPKEKVKAIISSHLVAIILIVELFLNASLYFALKSDNEPLIASLLGFIVLGYFGLVWQK